MSYLMCDFNGIGISGAIAYTGSVNINTSNKVFGGKSIIVNI